MKERPHDFHKILKKLYENDELWTMDDLYEYVRDVALPAYHSRPHEGHDGKTPYELYESLPKARFEQPSPEFMALHKKHVVERKISKMGIKFNKKYYWHDSLVGLAGNSAIIRYGKNDQSMIFVILNGHFLCVAEPKEEFNLVNENPERLQEHNAGQRKAYRDTRDNIRRKASRGIFVDEIDTTKGKGNITSLEHEKAARALRKAKAKAEQDKQPKTDTGRDSASSMFISIYDMQKKAR